MMSKKLPVLIFGAVLVMGAVFVFQESVFAAPKLGDVNTTSSLGNDLYGGNYSIFGVNNLTGAMGAGYITGGTFGSLSSAGNYIFDANTLFVDATNHRIGIGTASPGSLLNLYKASGDSLINIENTGNGNSSGINFVRERLGGTGFNGGSMFVDSDTSGYSSLLYLQAQTTSAQAGVTGPLNVDNGVRLLLRGGYGIFSLETGDTERLRVNASGNVGIGTASPAYRLHVYSPVTSTQPVRFQTPDGYLTIGPGNTGWSHFYTDRPGFWFSTGLTVDTGNFSSYDEALSLRPAGTVRMTIATSGYVGIGSTAPKDMLDIGGNYVRGSKTIAVGSTWTPVLSVNLGASHRSAYVKIFYGGPDWSNHSAPRYEAEFDVIDGGGSFGEPGNIVFQKSNVFSDQIQGRLTHIDPDTVNIELRTFDVEGNGFTAGQSTTAASTLLIYEVQGTFVSVGLTTGTITTLKEAPQLSIQRGYVGIGTSTPATALHVNGTVTASAFSGTMTGDLSAGYISAGTFGSLSTKGNYTFQTTASSGVVLFVDAGNGRVGIGTGSPTQALEVNGHIKLSPANPYIYSGSSWIGIPNGMYVSGGTFYAQNQAQFRAGIHNDAAPYLTIAGGTSSITYFTGSVGIGTAAPSEMFHVRGTAPYVAIRDDSLTAGGIKFKASDNSDRFMIDMDLDTTVVNDLLKFVHSGTVMMTLKGDGNIGIGTTTPVAALHINSVTNPAMILYTPSSATNYLQFHTNETGTSGLNDGLSIGYNSGAYIYNRENTNMIFGTNATARMIITNGGYVGIGTTTPAYSLVVNGTIHSSTGGFRFPDGTTQITAFLGGSQTINAAYVSAGIFGSTAGKGNYTFQASGDTDPVLYVDATNKRVGVGTTTPVYPLDVAGNARFNGGTIYNKNTSNSWVSDGVSWNIFYTSYGGIQLGPANAGWAHLYSTNNLNFYLNTGIGIGNNNTFLGSSTVNSYIAANGGNVGIGMATPYKKLEVASPANDFVTVGAASIGIGQYTGIHFGYRENNTLYRKSAIVFERTGNSAQGKIHILNDIVNDNGSAGLADAKLTISDNGNVGIGTTGPISSLQVYGGEDANRISQDDTYDYTEFAQRTNSGSHAILWGAFKSSSSVAGSLAVTGNTKYKRNEGAYVYGAGAIMYFANGGAIGFYISPTSTGAGTDVNWGGAKMFISRAGSVGIGTESPGYRLHVYGGQVNATGGFCINGDCKTAWSQVGGGVDPWTVSGANLTPTSTAYNVGIGTATPGRRLEVYVPSGGYTARFNNAGYYTDVYNDATWAEFVSNASQFYLNKELRVDSGMIGTYNEDLQLRTAGTTRVTITSTTLVGIGTVTPRAALDVMGAVKTSRLGTYGTYNSAEVQGIWSISEAFPISTGSNNFGTQYGMGYAYSTTGGAPFSGVHTIVFTNNGTIGAAVGLDGRAFFNGAVGIGTSTVGSYKLNVQGGSVNASGGLCMNGDCKTAWSQVGGSGGWTDGGTDVYVTTATDQVSIGTATPGTGMLNVYAPDSENLKIFGPTRQLSIYDTDTAYEYELATEGNQFKLIDRIAGGGTDRFVVSSNGYVGIATSSPSTQFQVIGNATMSGSVGIGTTAVGAYALHVVGYVNGTSGLCMNGDCKTAWSQVGGTGGWTDSGPYVYATGLGDRVGIGTATPGGMLMVYTTSSDDGTRLLGPSRQLNIYNTAASYEYEMEVNASNLFKIIDRTAGGGTDRITINTSGYVGIASSSPGYRLTAIGDIYSSAYVRAGSGLCIGTDCKTAWSQVGGGVNYWSISGSNLVPTSTAYKIGIGTATPGAKLDVWGVANENQLRITAYASQTNAYPIIRVNSSGGAELFRVHSDTASNLFIGNNAGQGNSVAGGGTNNTFVGYTAGDFNSNGFKNTAVGSQALQANTTSDLNTAVGYSALLYSSGGYNTAIGAEAMIDIASDYNTAVGAQALRSAVGTYPAAALNVAVGYQASYTNTSGSNNTVLGAAALYTNSTGGGNVAVGRQALYLNTASGNVAVGSSAMWNNSNGTSSAAMGGNALLSNTTGSGNAALGHAALYSNTTGNYNTAVGMWADVSSNGLVNATALGYNAKVNASNKVRIGNASVTVIEGQVAWSYPSDIRLKKDVKDTDLGLAFINELHPISYRLKSGDGNINYGFIAQEVETILGGKKTNIVLTSPDKDGTKTMRYTEFIAPMVKAMQEQQVQIEALKAENDALEARLSVLEEKLK